MSRTQQTSNQRLRRSAVAGGIAVLLLAGGGATWAAWSDQNDISAAQVTAGDLDLQLANTNGQWTVTHYDSNGTVVSSNVPVTDITAFRMVPGDVLTYTNSATIKLVGDNLKANLVVTPPVSPTTAGTLTDNVQVSAVTLTDTATNAAVANPMSAGTYSVAPTFTITFPYTTATQTGAQSETGTAQTLDLTQYKLSLTQVN